jgi:hypothetical protein
VMARDRMWTAASSTPWEATVSGRTRTATGSAPEPRQRERECRHRRQRGGRGRWQTRLPGQWQRGEGRERQLLELGVAPPAVVASYSGVARGSRRPRGQLREVSISGEQNGEERIKWERNRVGLVRQCVVVRFEEEEIESLLEL